MAGRASRALASIGALCALAACAAGGARGGTDAPPLESDLAAIAAFNEQYLRAINEEDVDALARLTTEDHIMIPPGRPPIVGKAANDELNGRVFRDVDIVETWTPQETVVTGDWAYQRGTFTVAATPKAGGATRNTAGHFLRIYRRQADGSWRMIRDMFNTGGADAISD